MEHPNDDLRLCFSQSNPMWAFFYTFLFGLPDIVFTLFNITMLIVCRIIQKFSIPRIKTPVVMVFLLLILRIIILPQPHNHGFLAPAFQYFFPAAAIYSHNNSSRLHLFARYQKPETPCYRGLRLRKTSCKNYCCYGIFTCITEKLLQQYSYNHLFQIYRSYLSNPHEPLSSIR